MLKKTIKFIKENKYAVIAISLVITIAIGSIIFYKIAPFGG